MRWQVLSVVLRNAWPAWLGLVGVVLAFLAGWLLSTTVCAAVRYSGMFLQVFGLCTVAVGLSKMRRLFRQPSLGTRVRDWCRQLVSVFTPPRPVSIQASAASAATMTGEVRAIIRAGPGTPLEHRVSLLEQNLDRLRDELDSKAQKLGREIDQTKQSVQHESQERRVENEKMARKIEEVAIGGLHLELIGLVWLVLGVLGTSIPDEIGTWLLRVF